MLVLSIIPSLHNLAIGNDFKSFIISDLKKIGSSKVNVVIKGFQHEIEDLSKQSEKEIMKKISMLADPRQYRSKGKYDNGCEFLLDWFNSLRK